MLRASISQGRAVLQRIVRGRITFTPHADGRGYDFSAPTRFDKLFSGILVPRPSFIPFGNTGAEHIGADDTWDADYGQLLERAASVAVNRKRVTSPAGFEPALPA